MGIESRLASIAFAMNSFPQPQIRQAWPDSLFSWLRR